MYIYNVTINIEETVHDEWLSWMKAIHIPAMLALGKFTQARFCRVLVEEEMGGITYSVQYTVDNLETLERYYKEDADKMREDGVKRFGNNFVAFRTELEVIGEFERNFNPATEYVFAYGTLQQEAVQKSLFTRTLQGEKDVLPGYLEAEDLVAGIYPTLRHTAQKDDSVQGIVITISGAELLKTDAYEGEAYFRKKVSLLSGKSAWVYLGKEINPI